MKGPGKILKLALGSIFKKPATLNYPSEKTQMPEGFRGKLKFIPEQCIGCRLCMRDCPAFAITISKIGEKKFECKVDLGKCIYCAQCVDTCPKKALLATREFELAQLTREPLKVTLNSVPAKPADLQPVDPPATQDNVPPPVAGAAG
jgi:formate hydrogenlyase subunit 6/NADH:ubiquinone oxidoreductase subunit I